MALTGALTSSNTMFTFNLQRSTGSERVTPINPAGLESFTWPKSENELI